MEYKYGSAPDEQFHSNESDIVKQIFRLLPAKEENDPNLDYLFTTLLFRISGLNSILFEPSELITVISYLESARTETDFKMYRKAILDSCSIMDKLIKKAGDAVC